MKLDGQKIDFANTHVTLKIYDIRKGDSGNKECFLQIKEDIKKGRLDLIDEISEKGSSVKDSDFNINPIRFIYIYTYIYIYMYVKIQKYLYIHYYERSCNV
jgi:hypothetical protein